MKRFVLPLLLGLVASACVAAPPERNLHAVELHGHRFDVELATDNDTRAQGLMNRTELAPDRGMLFAFPYTAPQSFWMKNTLIPLDMLFFDADRKLVSMQLDVPPCKADPCPTYPSGVPARYVLELAAGTAASEGVEVGDRLSVEGDVGPVR